jgi:hypothetical protein
MIIIENVVISDEIISGNREESPMRNLIPHFIQDQYQQAHDEGSFEALTMFVEVSDFTPMT